MGGRVRLGASVRVTVGFVDAPSHRLLLQQGADKLNLHLALSDR